MCMSSDTLVPCCVSGRLRMKITLILVHKFRLFCGNLSCSLLVHKPGWLVHDLRVSKVSASHLTI